MKRLIMAAAIALLAISAQTAWGARDKPYHWGDLTVESYALNRTVWYGNKFGDFRLEDEYAKDGALFFPIKSLGKKPEKLVIVNYWYIQTGPDLWGQRLSFGEAPYLKRSWQEITLQPGKTVTVRVSLPKDLYGKVSYTGVICPPENEKENK